MQKFNKGREAISKLSPEQYRVTQQCGTESPGEIPAVTPATSSGLTGSCQFARASCK